MTTKSREGLGDDGRSFYSRNIEVLKIHLDSAYECGESEMCEILIERLYGLFDELSRLER